MSQQRAALACLLACLYLLLCALVLQWLRTDLDPLQATLSQYLVGPGGPWLMLAYVGLSLGMLVLAWPLRRWPDGPGAGARGLALALAVAALGLGAVAMGDALCLPGPGEGHALFHHLAAALAFIGALVACALHAVRMWRRPHFAHLRRLAVGMALLCWLLLIAHLGALPGLGQGAGQKLLIASLVAWIALLAHSVRQRPASAATAPSLSSHAMDTLRMIERFDCGPRLAEMTVHNGVAYLAGQIPEDTSADITGQTAQVLADIDALLARAGTSKEHILRAEIFLADINDAPGMNLAWDAWVPAGCAPARATVEAKLVNKDWKVEIVVTAAIP